MKVNESICYLAEEPKVVSWSEKLHEIYGSTKNKIAAVKFIRKSLDIGLVDAKHVAEMLLERSHCVIRAKQLRELQAESALLHNVDEKLTELKSMMKGEMQYIETIDPPDGINKPIKHG